jgi:hypothetical protein
VVAAAGVAAGSNVAVTRFPAAFKLDNLLVVAARTQADDPIFSQNQSVGVWFYVPSSQDPLRQSDVLPPAEVIAGFLKTLMNCATRADTSALGGGDDRKLERLRALLALPKPPAVARQTDPPCMLLVRVP